MAIDAATTVAVTGGNGTLGSAVLAHLAEAGYRTVNLSRGSRREETADAYRRVDLLDAGQVYAALAESDADAVVHLGSVPTPTEDPGHVVFESNVVSAYHVLEAAGALGLESATLASSMSALGAGFEEKPVEVDALPVDESHRLSPSNPYGLGKQTVEVVADGFARRESAPGKIASLRFPWVTSDADCRETFVEADRSLDGLRESTHHHTAHNTLFAYVHVDDAVRLVRRCVEADFAGHERFWLSAPDTSVEAESERVVAEEYPAATLRRELEGYEALVDTAKAEELLGWEAKKSWRDLR
ncbi:NAD-dependent epimerase/dehydratase family protein [Halobium salinum]|uniref:NAD-dependent epimerase/dehydratase family protein n=1 Tax=Halobium salinum TaxID=1364940 RepID=A0ABD5PFQ3_9EURY|nr:NAD(P)-dependent oxidoreductase [Halobium salinum]